MADAEDEGDPTRRRCIVTGAVRHPEGMLRFVVAPDGAVVPDVGGDLPGRGIWLSASRDVVNTAVAKKLFAKAARTRVSAPEDLADRIERLLARRCLEVLGLARRAGQAVSGYEKVRARLQAGAPGPAGAKGVGVLLAATDGAAGGRDKIRALAPDAPLVALFDSGELGAALGRETAVHVLVGPGRLAERLLREASRLAGFRAGGIDCGGHPQGRE